MGPLHLQSTLMGRKPRVSRQGGRVSVQDCILGLTMPRHYIRVVEIGSNDGVYCRRARMGRMKPIRRPLRRKLPSDDCCLEKDEQRCLNKIEHNDDDKDELVKNKGKAKKDGSNNAFSASCFGLLEGGVDEDNEDSENKIRVNEVAGSADSKKHITELLNVGKDIESTESAKRKLCSYKRAKKCEELIIFFCSRCLSPTSVA